MNKKQSIIIFAEGGVLLSVQIIFSQTLAPFFGTSIYVYTALLVISMLAMSCGYLSGALMSERNKEKIRVSDLLTLSALLISTIPVFFHNFSPLLAGWDNKSLVLLWTGIFLFPVLTVTSMISMLMIAQNKGGLSVRTGKVFAIQSLGGIVLAIFTGYFLLPVAGTFFTYFILAIFLIIVSFLASEKNIVRNLAAIPLLFICFLFSGQPFYNTENFTAVYYSEGLNGTVMVMDSENGQYRSLLINGLSQAVFDNKTGNYVENYSENIASNVLKYPSDNILILGMGGGGLVHSLSSANKKNITVVELDDRIVYCAKEYFLTDECEFDLYIDDARHFIRNNKSGYDVIIADFHNGDVIPWHLLTLEAFKEMKEQLTEDGKIYFYFPFMAERKTIQVFQAMVNTLYSAGFFAYHFSADSPTGDRLILVASENPVADELLVLEPPVDNVGILTDDLQPADILLSSQMNLISYRKYFFGK